MELSHILLTHASDDFVDPDTVRKLTRDLREVRMSKLRKGFKVLGPSAGLKMNGVGAMEIAEVRGFVGGVVDNLRYVDCYFCFYNALLTCDSRKINRSREEASKEREADDDDDRNGFGSSNYNDEDDDMQL